MSGSIRGCAGGFVAGTGRFGAVVVGGAVATFGAVLVASRLKQSKVKVKNSLVMPNVRETGIRQADGGSCMCRQGLAEVSLASVGSVGCRGVAFLYCCVAVVMAGDGHFCCPLTRGKNIAISLRLVDATAYK
eukprot:scaffold165214_cov30-Cyclotella_meneghiniana.AAC.1